MGLTKDEAYDILELPVGADQDSIRTSYKRLALKWHPEKHNSSEESLKNFQNISKAYKKLSTGSVDEKNMSLDQMRSLFQDIFKTKPYTYNGSGLDSSDDDDDDDDDEDDDLDEEDRYDVFSNKMKLKQQYNKTKTGAMESCEKYLTPEEIDKNAQELITEEEKEKRRAEKRRAKKKRRRERKKLEKQLDTNLEPEKKNEKQKSKEGETEKKKKKDKNFNESFFLLQDFDPNSAFFTKVINKKKKQSSQDSSQSRKDKHKGLIHPGTKAEEEMEELDSIVLRSRQLAIKGNEMAQLGEYTAAIELFSEAVKLDPRDFRFLGNRSYCFDRIQQYDKALRDAEKAINLAKDWPKGYFRKGRALAGLKMYPDAEQAYTQVLKLDKHCEDAVQELLRVRTYQITDMGFSQQQAEAAIKQYGTVQQALDSLLAGVAENSLGGEVYVSDDEDSFQTATPTIPQSACLQHSPVQTPHKPDKKMDPANPEGLTALWVGNVLPEVSEKKLTQMFSKYGNVSSVRCLPDKYCAFVNFKTKESAGRALQALQGSECQGQRLLIKFPDNPIINGSQNFTLRKTTTTTAMPPVQPKPISPLTLPTPPAPTPAPAVDAMYLTETDKSYLSNCELTDGN
ncbi:hypothetical protein ScPMuIL_006744 [Solemya velum]